jgi:hypothetical protein
MKKTFAIGIGGAAGQGVATPCDIFAKIFSRRGLHLNAYNPYQSRVKKLGDDPWYGPADWMAAMGKSLLWNEEIPIGKFLNAPMYRPCMKQSQC